jgi:opacity protein-like surface antigen
VFVAGVGGSAALSSASVVQGTLPAAANYDPKVGPAVNVGVGYHFNDWVSAQAGYIWNRNRVIASELAGSAFSRVETTPNQHAVAFDALLYFRSRESRLRPYLSAGPALVNVELGGSDSERRLGWRVAVGIDIALHDGWGFRYTFSEMISGNPFAKTLNPPAAGRLMNFQNLFGVIKTF